MNQGEIWNANLNPTEGSEQAGFRPVVIISGNLLNNYANVVICCPLTTQIKNYHGNLVLSPTPENGLSSLSEVLTLHVRSLSKNRLKQRIGTLSKSEIKHIHKCLNEMLTY